MAPARRPRWLESLGSPRRRRKVLNHLNHCRDLDERFLTLLPSAADVVAELRSHEVPDTCYVISRTAEIDGQEMSLVEAVTKTGQGGWGTLIGCIPGRLAYYYDECGERRMLLER